MPNDHSLTLCVFVSVNIAEYAAYRREITGAEILVRHEREHEELNMLCEGFIFSTHQVYLLFLYARTLAHEPNVLQNTL